MMTRILLALSLLLPPLSALPAADIDFSAVASVRVGTNEVASISIGGTVVWERPAPAPAEVVLFDYGFDGQSEGSAGAIVIAVPRDDEGTGAWYRFRARPALVSRLGSGFPDPDNYVVQLAYRNASGDGARWVASPAVSGRVGEFSMRVRASGSGDDPALCAFLLPAAGTEDDSSSGWPKGYVSGGAWPAGAIVLTNGIVVSSTVWQTVSCRADIDLASPHRLFVGRMAPDSGKPAQIDDIRLTGIPAPAEEPGIYIDFDNVTAGAYGTVVEDYSGTVRFALEPTQNQMGWSFWLREGQSLPATPDDISGWTIVDPGTGGDLVMLWYDTGEVGSISGIDTDAPSFNPYGVSAGTVTVRKVPEP